MATAKKSSITNRTTYGCKKRKRKSEWLFKCAAVPEEAFTRTGYSLKQETLAYTSAKQSVDG